jgi:CBS domain-containing protein
MGLPFEGDQGPETRSGHVARPDPPTCDLDDVAGAGEFCVVVERGIVLAVVEDGEMRPGPSTFRPSVPREELAAYMDDHDLSRTLITTLDGRLVGTVSRGDL